MASEPISVRPLDAAVASEIRADMARLGFNISGMATAINMNRQPFTERYHGRRPFYPSELHKVAEVLGSTASEIVARAERTVDDTDAVRAADLVDA
ncbi:hypothetical protein [Promicromonospora sp. NPDC050880]|uniref:hypothetical protein n=1 Tax=Promicromonospora sp. NPDC050880 TaxID=3364406 RepID=UPI0037B43EB4